MVLTCTDLGTQNKIEEQLLNPLIQNLTWSYLRGRREPWLVGTQSPPVPIHAYEILLESGQESFTRCLHKPLELAKLPYNSTSSDGLTPHPSWVTALPVISTKNC